MASKYICPHASLIQVGLLQSIDCPYERGEKPNSLNDVSLVYNPKCAYKGVKTDKQGNNICYKSEKESLDHAK